MRSLQLLILATLSLMAASEEQPENDTRPSLEWSITDNPPVYIVDGVFANQGYGQKILDLLEQAMPQYHHTRRVKTISRVLLDIRNGKKTCYPAFYKTPEREKFIAFSTAAVMSPTQRLIVSNEHASSIQAPANLQAYLSNPQNRFVYLRQRSYGDSIDRLLNQLNEQQNIRSIVSPGSQILFSLVEKGRADGTIGFSFEVNYYSALNGSFDQFQTFPIQGIPAFEIGYIGCPQNEWGYDVIADIDTALVSLRRTDGYLEALTSWWGDDATDTHFKRLYQKFLHQGLPVESN